jgi:predicted anti-sigma-YlaC factor YlaD
VRRVDGVDCAAVATALPRLVDGPTRADRAVVRHVGQCLRCQAELAKYRRMLRLLHQLRDQRPPLPAGALESLLSGLEARAGARAARSSLGGRRLAVGVATVSVAVGAGVAGVVAGTAWARRRGDVPAGHRWSGRLVGLGHVRAVASVGGR